MYTSPKQKLLLFKENAKKSKLALSRMPLYNGWINFHRGAAGEAQQEKQTAKP